MENQKNQNQENALQPIENMVENADGQMFTTSLIIAQAFEKEHKNVLRDIENLECSPEFYQLNFEPINYEAEIGRGGGKREFTAYRITRDGFAFLAMGFTFQLDWIPDRPQNGPYFYSGTLKRKKAGRIPARPK